MPPSCASSSTLLWHPLYEFTRTRNVRPPKFRDLAARRTSSSSPDARSSSTKCASATRRPSHEGSASVSTARRRSSARMKCCGRPEASNAANVSARARAGCSPDSSTRTRTAPALAAKISSFGGDTVTLKMSVVMRASVVHVRLFSPQDLPAVAAIVKDALRENYPTSLYLDIHRWWRDGFLVAEERGAVVWFLAAVVSAPEQARILMLAVYSTWRRRRVGSALMDSFLKECAMRGIASVELEVRKSNEPAIKFYMRYGFEVTTLLPKFYTDGEDGFKMRRGLR